MHNKWSIGLAASAMLLAGSAFAQQAPAKANKSELSSADRTFIREVARDNQAEVKTAKLMEQKTIDPAIRQYAKDLRSDHSNAETQLKNVASSLGVTLPTQLNAKQTANYDQLKKLSGKQLDTAFLKEQLRDHKQAISKFDRELKNSQDPAVKGYAAMTLPHLQDHIRIAEDLTGSMNMTGKAGLNKPSEAVSAQALTQGTQNQNAKTKTPPRPY